MKWSSSIPVGQKPSCTTCSSHCEFENKVAMTIFLLHKGCLEQWALENPAVSAAFSSQWSFQSLTQK